MHKLNVDRPEHGSEGCIVSEEDGYNYDVSHVLPNVLMHDSSLD